MLETHRSVHPSAWFPAPRHDGNGGHGWFVQTAEGWFRSLAREL
jgi:hypothetical protein